MGFKFGLVSNLNSKVTLLCFLGVILFLVVFDFFVNLLEFFLEGDHLFESQYIFVILIYHTSGSELYNRMVQMIYKELMLMGLVSFTVIMIEASKKEDPNHHDDWIIGIDFSHIVIFFLTFFFVAHAFYLMWTSVSCASIYRFFS